MVLRQCDSVMERMWLLVSCMKEQERLVRVVSLGNGSWDLSFDVTEVDLTVGRRR